MLPEGWYFREDRIPLEAFGRFLEDRTGWDDTPPLRGDNTVLLGRHGEVSRRKRYGPGRKPLVVAVHGVLEDLSVPVEGTAQRALYEKNLDGLLRVISPRQGAFPVLRVYADGSRRTALCEVTNELTPAVNGYTYGAVSFDLIVPGSFWLDEDALSYELPYDVAGADAQTVEVYSLAGQTAPCADPVVTITGPCDSVSVADPITGSGFGFDALDAGQVLVVDAAAFSATLDGGSVLTDLDLYAGELLEISAAPTSDRGPDLVVTAPGKGSGFSVVIEARRAWLR
jgi:hypothetical protein